MESNRVSQDQMDQLLDYLMLHPNLAKGVELGARSKEAVERQWDGLASTLNALGSGSSKTGDRWKRYWADLKHKAKTRAALRRKDQDDTGGGPPNTMGDLSETDQKVLAIIGTKAVFGDVQHRVPLFRPQTNVATIENQDAHVSLIGVEDDQLPVFSSQTEEAREIEDSEVVIGFEEESPATAADNLSLPTNGQTTRAETTMVIPISPSTSGQTLTRAGTAAVNICPPSTSGQSLTRAGTAVGYFCPPSTSGQTSTRADEAENRERQGRPSARRLFPPAQINSPVSHSRRGRTRNMKTSGNQVKADSAWVMELERKRVEAEEKLANAALIMAEASRVQAEASRAHAEAARSQVEVARMLADSLATLIKYIDSKK